MPQNNNLHPVLIPAKRSCPFSLHTDSGDIESSTFIELHIGVICLERVPNERSHFLYKMLVARLRLNGFQLKGISKMFDYSENTIRHWAEVLRSGSANEVAQLFGLMHKGKLTHEVRAYIEHRYHNLTRNRIHNFRRQILGELKDIFELDVSGETLRTLFREIDKKQSEEVEEDKMEPAFVHENHAPDDVAVSAPDDSPGENEVNLPAIPVSKALDGSNSPAVLPEEYCPEIRSLDSDENYDESPSETADQTSIESDPDMPKTQATCSIPAQIWPKTHKSTTVLETSPKVISLPLSEQRILQRSLPIHHLGLVLFFPVLQQLKSNLGKGANVCLQVIAQLLQSAQNIEQNKTLNLSSLKYLIGPCLTDQKSLRAKLTELSSPEFIRELLAVNLSLLHEQSMKLFYYDPHGKDYTGTHPLLKGWCGRLKSTLKVLYSDYIHSEQGSPLFMKHYDNFYDLRERILFTISEFQSAFPPLQRAGMTFVVDRGIYGIEAMLSFLKSKCHLITWEKNYKKSSWDNTRKEQLMNLTRLRNSSCDKLISTISYQENTWRVNSKFRQIILRITSPKGKITELSILCSNQLLGATKIIDVMLRRWLQENDFCYLRTHYGIDQIDSYSTCSYEEISASLDDRMVEGREFYAHKKQRTELKKELNKLILNKHNSMEKLKKKHAESSVKKKEKLHEILQGMELDMESGELAKKGLVKISRQQNSIDKLEQKHAKIQEEKESEWASQISESEENLADIELKMQNIIREESRVESLIEQGYCVLDTSRKAVLDMLRIIARNVFYTVIKDFQSFYDNQRDDHVMLRTLAESSGNIYCQGEFVVFELWVKAEYSKSVAQKIEAFLRFVETRSQEYFKGVNFKPIIKIQPTVASVKLNSVCSIT